MMALRDEDAAIALRNCLDKHGYGFQYATLKRCLSHDAALAWRYGAAEYPVHNDLKGSGIDFVLGANTHVLVSECKRVSGWLNRDSRRSIAIVNEKAVEAFLRDLITSLYGAVDPLEQEQ
jgi:hypothetical protein